MNKYLQRGQTCPIPIWPDLPLSPLPTRRSKHIFFIPYSRCCTNTSWSFWKVSSPFHYSNIFRRTSARQISQRNGTRLPGSAEWKRALLPVSWKRIYPITVLQSTKCCPLCMNVRIQLQCMFRGEGRGEGFFVDLKNHTLLVTLTGHMTL